MYNKNTNNVDINNIVKEFSLFLQSYCLFQDLTIKAYERDITEFITFNKILTLQNASDVTKIKIRLWIQSKQVKHISNRSICRYISSLKAFYKFLNEKYDIINSDIINMSGLKFCNTLPKDIPTDKILEVINNVHSLKEYKTNETLLRDKLLLTLLFSTGLRISEALSLTFGHIEEDQNTIRIVGKGNKERIVPVPNIFLHTLTEYKASIENNSFNDKIFYTLSIRKAQLLFEEFRTLANLPKHYTPHAMRHSCATTLLENGANIKEIQTLLGHSNLSTTQRYVNVSKKNLAKKLSQVKW